MTVFIAGATGVLGWRLVREFADQGHDVVGLARDEAGDRIVEDAGGTPRRGDVLDRDSLREAVGDADAVIHAATAIPTKTKTSAEDWERNDRIRREGTRNLVAAAGAADADHYVQQSVVWVARQPDGSAFDEDAPPNPDRTTESAADAERIALEAAEEYGFETAVLRGGWFYAPDAAHTRTIGEQLLAGRLPIIGGGLLGRRDAELSCVHAADAARAYVAAVEAGVSGRYHVVDDEPVTTASFFRTFADLLDAPAPRRIPGWLARPLAGRDSVRLFTNPMPTSNDRFVDATGWEPRYPTVRDGLSQVVEAWKREGVVQETGEGYEWTGSVDAGDAAGERSPRTTAR